MLGCWVFCLPSCLGEGDVKSGVLSVKVPSPSILLLVFVLVEVFNFFSRYSEGSNLRKAKDILEVHFLHRYLFWCF